jgi:hypothetical protein
VGQGGGVRDIKGLRGRVKGALGVGDKGVLAEMVDGIVEEVRTVVRGGFRRGRGG